MTGIFLGPTEISTLSLGSDSVEIYVGNTKIFPNAPSPVWTSSDPYANNAELTADWPAAPSSFFTAQVPGMRAQWSTINSITTAPTIPSADFGDVYRVDFTISNTFNIDDHSFIFRFSQGSWDTEYTASPPTNGTFSFTTTCTTPALNVPLQAVFTSPSFLLASLIISDIRVTKL